jgi:hypothetical protein
MIRAMASQSCSMDLAAASLSKAWSLAKAFSIGLGSGLQGGSDLPLRFRTDLS